jgi:hypothetical protein
VASPNALLTSGNNGGTRDQQVQLAVRHHLHSN